MNNINFFLRELDMSCADNKDNTNNNYEYDFNLQKKIDELNNYKLINKTKQQKTDEMIDPSFRDLFLSDKCTLKELLKICNFYNIEKLN